MTPTNRNPQRVADEVDAIRAEYAEEEAEAAETEAAERNAALDIPLNLRIDKDLDTQLRHRAAQAPPRAAACPSATERLACSRRLCESHQRVLGPRHLDTTG